MTRVQLGDVFGMLTVVASAPRAELTPCQVAEGRRSGDRQWECSCRCGASRVVRAKRLTIGQVWSCGCGSALGLAERRKFRSRRVRDSSPAPLDPARLVPRALVAFGLDVSYAVSVVLAAREVQAKRARGRHTREAGRRALLPS